LSVATIANQLLFPQQASWNCSQSDLSILSASKCQFIISVICGNCYFAFGGWQIDIRSR